MGPPFQPGAKPGKLGGMFCIGMGPLPPPGKLNCMFARLKPRGVPVGMCPAVKGKWPLLAASDREGEICAGSRA